MIGKWEYGRVVVVGCDKGTNLEVDLRDEAKSRAFQVFAVRRRAYLRDTAKIENPHVVRRERT